MLVNLASKASCRSGSARPIAPAAHGTGSRARIRRHRRSSAKLRRIGGSKVALRTCRRGHAKEPGKRCKECDRLTYERRAAARKAKGLTGHEPHIDGRSVIAAPLNPGATLSTIVPPASPAMSAPDSRQDSASPSNSAQAAPVDAITTAVTAPATTTVTELPQQPVAAPKKSQTAPSQNRRDRGWYDASAWRRYGHERPSSSW
jgi:hypothetical protein